MAGHDAGFDDQPSAAGFPPEPQAAQKEADACGPSGTAQPQTRISDFRVLIYALALDAVSVGMATAAVLSKHHLWGTGAAIIGFLGLALSYLTGEQLKERGDGHQIRLARRMAFAGVVVAGLALLVGGVASGVDLTGG